LQATSVLVSFLRERKLIEAGEALAISSSLEITYERVEKARAARLAAAVSGLQDDDPYLRD
jgi:hypothetical protein